MRKLFLGNNASGRPIYLTPEMRRFHMHVSGASGGGKSKFLEWLIRQLILRRGGGVMVLDWHGTLCRDLVNWCCFHGIGHRDRRELILVDPTQNRYVTPLNFFTGGKGQTSTQV